MDDELGELLNAAFWLLALSENIDLRLEDSKASFDDDDISAY